MSMMQHYKQVSPKKLLEMDEEGILDWLLDNYHRIKDLFIDARKKGNAVFMWLD